MRRGSVLSVARVLVLGGAALACVTWTGAGFAGDGSDTEPYPIELLPPTPLIWRHGQASATEMAPPAAGPRWSRPVPLDPEPRPATVPPGTSTSFLPAWPVSPLPAAHSARPARGTRPGPLTGTHGCVLEEGTSFLVPPDPLRQLGEQRLRRLFVLPGPDR